MVRVIRANTNAEIHAPRHPIRRPEDRRSMHPCQLREAEWVARWPLGQRRARGPGGGRAGSGDAARVSCAHPRTRPPTDRARIPANPDGARVPQKARQRGLTRQGPAQRFLVGINDVVDEPLARGRMDHQEFDRPLRPAMQRHFRGTRFSASWRVPDERPIGRAPSRPRSTHSCRPRRSKAARSRLASRTRSRDRRHAPFARPHRRQPEAAPTRSPNESAACRSGSSQ